MWEDERRRHKTKKNAIEFNGIPYMNLGFRIMDCCCGVSRRKTVSKNYSVSTSLNDD